MRHGRTAYSREYITNGDPAKLIALDDHGREQCLSRRREGWANMISCRVTSEFLRARQTAELIAPLAPKSVVLAELNELDYGDYEGRQWFGYGAWLAANGDVAVPPGSAESRLGSMARMLLGLELSLRTPTPRLIVGHGLLISLITAVLAGQNVINHTLPEASYTDPVVFDSDAELAAIIEAARRELAVEGPGR